MDLDDALIEVLLIGETDPDDLASWQRAPEWHTFAACHGHDLAEVDAWFPDVSTPPAVVAAAVDVCRTECPVRLECLAASLARDERHGTWGGLTAKGRRRLREERRHRAGLVIVSDGYHRQPRRLPDAA